jgi:hypothetical protein
VSAGSSKRGNGISYHGGAIIPGTTNAYVIWYGTWPASSTTPAITTDFLTNVGGSAYYNINTTYNNGTVAVSNAVHYVGSTTTSAVVGTTLTDAGVQGVVSSAISSGRLPKDANGVYFVLTAADVDETSGFCSSYCGWHYYGSFAKAAIKYAFIGNSDRCPNDCTRLRFHSPNDNIGGDGMASVIAHELSEAVTDPLLTAWYDKDGEENADKCAFTFGDLYSTPNGSGANVRWGSRDYLIQRNWVNAGGGSCAVGYP